MATELSSLKESISSPAQLLRRLEQHDYLHSRSDDHREWTAGRQDWDEIKQGAETVPNGREIMTHYLKARNLAYYGHE